MKIAIISHLHFPTRQPYAGGLETHTHVLADKLVAMGHDVTLFAKYGSKSNATVISIFSGNAMGGKNVLLNVAYRYACKLIQASNFDLIINNSLNSYPLKWHDTGMPPMITIFHTPPLPEITKVLRGMPEQDNRSYIAVSEFTAQQWQPFCSSLIHTVRNGVDTEAWLPCAAEPKRQIAWAGRITHEKGVHVAIEAALITDMPLILSGPIYDKKYFKHKIKHYITCGAVTYLGQLSQPKVNALYAESQVVLVTPLWDEPFGLVSIEAMASGTPVAALGNGAVPSIINRLTGAIAADDRPESLASAIISASQLSREDCRLHAVDNYSIDQMIAGYFKHMPVLPDATSELRWQTYP